MNFLTTHSIEKWTRLCHNAEKAGPGAGASLGHVSFYDLGSSSSDTAGEATRFSHLDFIYAIFLYNIDTKEQPVYCVEYIVLSIFGVFSLILFIKLVRNLASSYAAANGV